MEKLDIKSMRTTNVKIINLDELDAPRVKATINRIIKKESNDNVNSYFSGYYNAVLEKDDETEDNRTFWVNYEIYVEFSCNNPNATAETIVSLTTTEIYPHLRAGVAAVMAAASIQPLFLPPTAENSIAGKE